MSTETYAAIRDLLVAAEERETALLAAVRYTADMLAQDAGNGETVGERLGLIGGFRAAELCRIALARIDPTPPRTT